MTSVEIKMKSMLPDVILRSYCKLDINRVGDQFLKIIRENAEIVYVNGAMTTHEADNYTLNKFEESKKLFFAKKIEDLAKLFDYENKGIELNNWDNLMYDGGEVVQSFHLIVSPLTVTPVFKFSFNMKGFKNKKGTLILYNSFPRTAYAYSNIEPRFFRIKDHYASIMTGSPIFNIINTSLIEGIAANVEKVEHTNHCTDGFSTWDEKETHHDIINYTLTLSSKKTIVLDELNYLDLITYLVPFGENDVYGG